MDNLLDKLRAGELDTNIKRTRNNERSTATYREKRMQRSESVAILAEDLLKSIQSDTDAALSDSPPLSRGRLNGGRRNKGSRLELLEEIPSA